MIGYFVDVCFVAVATHASVNDEFVSHDCSCMGGSCSRIWLGVGRIVLKVETSKV